MKGGRIKYKTETETDLGMETQPGEGVMKEEKFPNSRKPSHRHVCEEFLESQRATQPGEKKKKKPTEYVPNCNYKWRWRSGIEAHDENQA